MEHGQVSPGRLVIIRLDPGEDLLQGLQRACEERGIKNAVIVSGYGALKKVHYHAIAGTDYPPKDRHVVHERPLELVSLSGIIANGNIHAHIGVSTLEKAFGGHLEPGTIVAYLAEIALLEIAEGELVRTKHPQFNTDYLQVKSS